MSDATTTRTAGSAIVAALGDDIDQLHGTEDDVRADVPDSIHQMRVATRRLRSVLGSSRSALRRSEVDRIRGELRWLATILGVARDAEVRADRLSTLLDRLQAEQRRGHVADRLVVAQRTRYATAHTDVVAALDSDRYRGLVELLARLRTDPPLRRAADEPAEQLLAHLVRKDYNRLERLIDAADAVEGDRRVTALHDVRKAAKRLRYTAEAATPASAEHIGTLAKRAKKLQTVLGDHRDAVESGETIAAAEEEARAAGEDDTTYRLLAESEARSAEEAIAQYRPAVAALRRSAHD